MKNISSVMCLSILLIFCTHAYAYTKDTQGWMSIATAGSINHSRWLFWFDSHARFGDDISELDTSIIRPALGWQISPNTSVWLGYARVTGHAADPNIEEDRIWQQALYRVGELAGGQLSARSRIEQRMRDEDSDIGVRLRQFFRWVRPVQNSDLSYVVGNELFINLNDADWGQNDGFNQNRLFLGLNYRIDETYRVEFGYMNNYIHRDGTEDHMNNIISSTISVSW